MTQHTGLSRNQTLLLWGSGSETTYWFDNVLTVHGEAMERHDTWGKDHFSLHRWGDEGYCSHVWLTTHHWVGTPLHTQELQRFLGEVGREEMEDRQTDWREYCWPLTYAFSGDTLRCSKCCKREVSWRNARRTWETPQEVEKWENVNEGEREGRRKRERGGGNRLTWCMVSSNTK